ncbi:uncharacterized protein LOC143610985 [Bidens hawaiensis]|uniref:uncharacterized protein LOC143610985 n=1 Tax=Bidens hawaiensis TaxID=980011 RepID=UPI00404B3340
MNAKALKKFAEENQKLTVDLDDLLTQHAKWDNECTLYEHHIEDLMDLGNQVYERAKEAESCEDYLEGEISKLLEELESMKQVSEGECNENFLIDSLVSTLVSTDEVASASYSFLEAYSGVDVCEKMLKIWDDLNPSTHNILALASKINRLQKDKEILRMNLIKAEEEVTVLCDENDILDKENVRLTNLLDSDGSHSSGFIKSCKRKSSKGPVEKENDFSDAAGLPRRVLSQCYVTHNNCTLI